MPLNHGLRQVGWVSWLLFLATPTEGGQRMVTSAHRVSSRDVAERYTFQGPEGFLGEGQRSLWIAHDQVKERWEVLVGDQSLGFLDQIEQPTWSVFDLPEGTVLSSVSLIPPDRDDSIVIEAVRAEPKTLGQAQDEASLSLRVTDEGGGFLPSRLTVIDEAGFLVPFRRGDAQGRSALRTGVLYTTGEPTRIGLPTGRYRGFITRGPEYERRELHWDLPGDDPVSIEVQLPRSVHTDGWISCDPHTHTFTHSRHGDATTEERVLTIAGEGIELPIATDHNRLVDYEPASRAMGVRSFFTPVIGDEVTTKEANFNVFPLTPGAVLPEFRVLNWPELIRSFRERSKARVVILNHPHNVHNGFRPFDRRHLNPVSGRVLKTLDFSVDAMEVLSSSAQQTDFMRVFGDWFSILNQGHHVVGVGSSDVHDVNRYVLGQGRTYLRGDDAEPGKIDVDAACRALVAGKALISMGLFVDLNIDEAGGVGDLVSETGSLHARVSVQCPSWMEVDEVKLFANGEPVNDEQVASRRWRVNQQGGKALEVIWNVSAFTHDVYLIAVATGPGTLGPSWPIPFPYQPSGEGFVPRVIGATNPLWIDRDADGRFESARELGEQVWAASEERPREAVNRLGEYHVSVAVQVADMAHESGRDLFNEMFVSGLSERIRSALERLQDSFGPQ